jgi:hypothetical protein
MKILQDDLLDRAPFAQLVAEAVLAAQDHAPSVFALCGGWGSGKTWTIQKMIEIIGDRATVLEFEPWMVSTPEALAREFFLDLSRGILGSDATVEANERRERYWRYAAQVLDVSSAVAAPLSMLGVPGAGVVQEIAKRTKDPIRSAAEGLKVLSQRPSLQDSRRRIGEQLRGLPKPVLMAIDDIDRLADDEIRTLFRLIKACADFPNVMYLLAFDRPQIVRALGEAFGNGEEFLDKILASSFDLPAMGEGQKANYLVRSVRKAIPAVLRDEASKRLDRALDEVLLPGMGTLRLIDTYTRTASVLIAGLVHEGELEVDPADFLVLEFLRQRFPSVYAVLRDWDAPNPGGRVRRLTDAEEIRKERSTTLKNALQDVGAHRELVNQAIQFLSTSQVRFLEGDLFASAESAHKTKRLSSEYWRPVYFGFDAGRAALPYKDFLALKSALAGNSELSEWMKKFDDFERRGRVATILMTRLNDLNEVELKNLLIGLLLWGERRPYDQPAEVIGFSSWPRFVGRVGASILQSLKRYHVAMRSLNEAYESTRALLGIASIVAHEKVTVSAGDDRWSSPEEFEILLAKVTDDIRQTIRSREIWQHPNARDLYAVYHDLVDGQEAEDWFQGIWRDESQLIQWTNRVLPTYIMQDGRTALAPPTRDVELQALKDLPGEKLSEPGRRALAAYMKHVRRRQGRECSSASASE